VVLNIAVHHLEKKEDGIKGEKLSSLAIFARWAKLGYAVLCWLGLFDVREKKKTGSSFSSVLSSLHAFAPRSRFLSQRRRGGDRRVAPPFASVRRALRRPTRVCPPFPFPSLPFLLCEIEHPNPYRMQFVFGSDHVFYLYWVRP